MTKIGATQLRNNLYKTLDTCLKYKEAISINTKNGNLVLLTEEKHTGLNETAFLSSVDGMKESIIDGLDTPLNRNKAQYK